MEGLAMGGQSERRRRRGALLATLMLAGSLAAHAGSDGGAVAVSANVMAKTGCLFVNNGSPALLNFGQIDQASLANATASTTVTIRCRGNLFVTWGVTADTGLNPTGTGVRRMRNDAVPGELMPYSLTLTSASGSILLFWGGATRTIGITGTITPASFQSVAAGDYSDSVKLTLNF
jgi:spore coat protein U-like protein